MEIIKRRLIKYFIYNRKQPNKAIALESLGLDSDNIDTVIDNIMERIDFTDIFRILKYTSKESCRMILSPSQIRETLIVMLKDLLTNYYSGQGIGFYRGEQFSLSLTLNRKGKHILTLMPNIDIL